MPLYFPNVLDTYIYLLKGHTFQKEKAIKINKQNSEQLEKVFYHEDIQNKLL